MKKFKSVLFLCFLIGSIPLFAQTPEEDTMMNIQNGMRSDSMPAKNKMRKDNMGKDSTKWHKKDSSFNNRRERENPQGNRMNSDSSMNFNSTQKEGEMPSNKKKRPDNDEMNDEANRMKTKPDINNWPEASQMAVEEITAKYGQPDGITNDELFWLNKGPWKKICITKAESKHSFPIEHTDMMQTTINYNVPEAKMDDLGIFDGSVTFDRTQGTMSARCDKESNNFLALNLANDIIVGKKTVAQARKAYGDIVKSKMNGMNPAYMAKLNFTAKTNTADPDKNTTGLTKEDVAQGGKKQ